MKKTLAFLIAFLMIIMTGCSSESGGSSLEKDKTKEEGSVPPTVGIGSMCMVDLGHAGATACGNWVLFFSKLNIVAWAKFGQMGVQELQLMAGTEIRNIKAIQDDISDNWQSLLERSNNLLTE